MTASGGATGQEVFHHRLKSFTCVSAPGSIPGAPAKKALAVTQCNGMILKNVFGQIRLKMLDGILRREPEQGF